MSAPKRQSAGGGEPAPKASHVPDISPPPPHSASEKKTEVPSFSVSQWISANWRERISIPEEAKCSLPGTFSTQDSTHIARIYDLAVKKHQELACGRGGKTADCAFCVAQGGLNPWKGDAKKKFVSLSLYLEVIKHYIPEVGDYCSQFPDEAEDLSTTEDVKQLEVNDHFFDSLFPMWYCSKCYPDLPKAVLAMDAFERYQPAFEKEKQRDPSFYSERQKVLSDLRSSKLTQRKEFGIALKAASIMSKLDWELHKLCDKHQHKELVKPASNELQEVKSSLEAIKKQISMLEMALAGEQGRPSKFIQDAAHVIFKQNGMAELLENSKIATQLLVKAGDDGKTDMETCIEKVVKSVFATDQTLKELSEWFETGRQVATEADAALCDERFKKCLADHSKLIDGKLIAFKTDIIGPKFQEIAQMLATIDGKLGKQ